MEGDFPDMDEAAQVINRMLTLRKALLPGILYKFLGRGTSWYWVLITGKTWIPSQEGQCGGDSSASR